MKRTSRLDRSGEAFLPSNIIDVSSNTTRKTRTWTRRATPLATTFVILACAIAPATALPAAFAVGMTSAAIVGVTATIRSALLTARASMATTRSVSRTLEAVARPGTRPIPVWLIVLITALVTVAIMLLILWIIRSQNETRAKPTS